MTRTGARLWRGAQIAALLAILLTDLVLIRVMLRPGSPPVTKDATPAKSSARAPAGQAAAASGAEPAGAATRAGASSPAAAGEGKAPSPPARREDLAEWARERVLLDFDSDIVLRASPGSCRSDLATLERSGDGRTWDTAVPPARAVLAITATGREVSLVGTDASCVPEKWVSDDRGATWRQAGADGDWYLLPEERRSVHAPGGSVQSPCRRSFDLAPTGKDDAALLCGSGSTYLTRDAGQSWARGDGVEGAVDLAFSNSSTGWVLVPRGRCQRGVAVLATTDGAASWERRACVDVAEKAPLGLAFRSKDHGLLLAGDTTYATTDGGRTWKRTRRS